MRITEIRHGQVGVAKEGGPVPWRLSIQDMDTKEVVWIALPQQVVDEMVKAMTGGVVVASKLPPGFPERQKFQ